MRPVVRNKPDHYEEITSVKGTSVKGYAGGKRILVSKSELHARMMYRGRKHVAKEEKAVDPSTTVIGKDREVKGTT